MSVVASRPQPNPTTSITNLNGHHLTDGLVSKANGSGGASLIENMLAAKQHFGEPVGKNTLDLKSGVREVLPGPRSPKVNGNGHLPNGHGKGNLDIGDGESEGEEDEESSKESTPSKDTVAEASSSSTLIGPTLPAHLSTPSRKGKETANSSPFTPLPTPRTPRAAAGGRSLHEDPIDLTWPTHLRARKQSAAGLYNPSMACYANATLQVLLHTPPVLRIAQSHTVTDCKSSLPSSPTGI